MKIIMTVLLLIQCTILSYGQEATSLRIFDTRDIVDQPSFLKRSIRADFKNRATIGVPGVGMYSTNITIAPWLDASGNLNHQLNFNNGGIYYRQGDFRNSAWNNWSKILLTDPDGIIRNGIRIGTIGQIGNANVATGEKNIQYNIDFTGYRDVQPDQIGARISAIRYNNHIINQSYIQKTALVFYTNPLGLNGGTTDLLERMRISPDGNVGIGVANPQNKLDVAGTIRAKENIVGERVSSEPGEIKRMSLIPYKHTGGPWEFISRDTPADAFLDINYGINKNLITVQHTGRIGIGVSNPQNKLDVKGKIRAEEIIVETGWADFVFDEDYKLPSLEEVESHIHEHKRLPDIPSESQIKEEGVGLGEMQVKLLQKIEELTLYIIKQEKRIQELEKKR